MNRTVLNLKVREEHAVDQHPKLHTLSFAFTCPLWWL